MSNFQKTIISEQSETLKGSLFSNTEDSKPQLFFFHGGGSSNKDRTSYISEELATFNIPSFAFDFSGSGESSGEIVNSSLEKRVKEAKTTIKHFNTDFPINLCGSSMGGYIALKLLDYYPIKSLILFCPAVYDKSAYSVNFGEEFSEIIRRENSWENSDIFSSLEKFRGNLLIFVGLEDRVIPQGVIGLLDKHSKNCNKKEIITIPGCPHKVHLWIPEHKKVNDMVISKIKEFLN